MIIFSYDETCERELARPISTSSKSQMNKPKLRTRKTKGTCLFLCAPCFQISVSCLSMFDLSLFMCSFSRFRSPAFLTCFPISVSCLSMCSTFPDFGLLPFLRAFPFRSPAAFLCAPCFQISAPCFPISVSSCLSYVLSHFGLLLPFYVLDFNSLPYSICFSQFQSPRACLSICSSLPFQI